MTTIRMIKQKAYVICSIYAMAKIQTESSDSFGLNCWENGCLRDLARLAGNQISWLVTTLSDPANLHHRNH